MNEIMTRRPVRKNIWEMDCLSLTTILAGALDWKELANFLSGLSAAEAVQLPNQSCFSHCEEKIRVYSIAHQLCHSQNPVSERLQAYFVAQYENEIAQVDSLEIPELCHFTKQEKLEEIKNIFGFIWALATDQREKVDPVRVFFLHRFLGEAVSDWSQAKSITAV